MTGALASSGGLRQNLRMNSFSYFAGSHVSFSGERPSIHTRSLAIRAPGFKRTFVLGVVEIHFVRTREAISSRSVMSLSDGVLQSMIVVASLT